MSSDVYCIQKSYGGWDTIMTVDEVADFLRVDQGTVLELVMSGEIPGYKLENKLLFWASNVWRYFLKQPNTEFVKYEPSPQPVRDPD